MAAQNISGWGTYANYGKESTFATAVTANAAFGFGVDFSVTSKNNQEAVFGLGARNAQSIVSKKFEGSFDLNFILGDGLVWEYLVGTKSGASNPFTYTETDLLSSLTIENGMNIDSAAADAVRTYKGCIIGNWTLSSAVGELVKIKASGMYANEALTTTYGTVATDGTEPVTFADGVIVFASLTVGKIQNVEITCNQSVDYVWDASSATGRVAKGFIMKNREYTFKFTGTFENTNSLAKFYGAASAPIGTLSVAQAAATLILTFTSGSRTHTVTCNNVFFDEHSQDMKVDQLLVENITGKFKSMGVTA